MLEAAVDAVARHDNQRLLAQAIAKGRDAINARDAIFGQLRGERARAERAAVRARVASFDRLVRELVKLAPEVVSPPT